MTPRHALVVSPRGGVGTAVAEELRRRGVRVSGAGRREPEPGVVEAFHPFELTSGDWPALYQRVAGEGPLDAVVYAAGAGAFGRTVAFSSDEAREVFEVNFWALAAAASAAADRWSRNGSPACFLAVLSIAGRRPVPFEAWYGASKAAAARYLEALQLEVPPSIRFVPAFPGLIRTGFRASAPWKGLVPAAAGAGASPEATARRLCDLLEGTRRSRVLGWRERAIDVADRLAPGLYDRLVLRGRAARMGGE